MVDCAVIGGGPAGANAALVLGRARRSVIVFDNNQPRNAVTRHTHGFITRDGVTPNELRRLARNEVAAYPSVSWREERVKSVARVEGGFRLQTEDGAVHTARKLLLATGLKETLPSIPGIADFYGISLFSCPYCDGWELRDRPLIVIAESLGAFSLARLAYQWSKDLLVCTNGAANALRSEELRILGRKGISVTTHRIRSLEGKHGMLSAVQFDNGKATRRTGGFVSPYWRQAEPFGKLLGCALTDEGGLRTDNLGRTSVYGVYAAGDASIIAPAQAVIAAGEGSKAAIGINTDLVREDF